VSSNSAAVFLQAKWQSIAQFRWRTLEAEWASLLQNPQFKEAGMRKALRLVKEREHLTQLLRRIECYLGFEPKQLDPENIGPGLAELEKYTDAVRCIRVLIQSGESEETIIALLMLLVPSSNANGKCGRPKGTIDHDESVLSAMELRDSDPKEFSWPKLADELLDCKVHNPHTSESECVDKLKKAVKRLRVFLQKLGYEQAGK
jgi:hypothetical protein